MNILLATYSYYPYNYGGTEVYISGLANYLKNQRHELTIIAGMPPGAFDEYPVFYEDEALKTIQYKYEGINVIGVILKDETTTEIYRKYRESWNHSWYKLLNKLTTNKFDILHLHANTSPVGESLIKAIQIHSPQIKYVATYHLPISCVKGTLLFGNRMEACTVTPAVNICTACTIATRQQWPMLITKPLAKVMPLIADKSLPTAIRLKYLVKEFISAFQSLDHYIDKWHVFSHQIKQILLLNHVENEKILLLKHGVSSTFFLPDDTTIIERSQSEGKIFLYAGRFDQVKGFFTLLKAWDSLPQSDKRKLLIAGENQTGDKEVEKLIQLLQVRKDILFVGATGQQELAVLMKKVHCTIIPSEWVEIGPLIFHEAIAAGSDVIAADLGGCRELATRFIKKATIFEVGNIMSLKNAIEAFNYSGVHLEPDTQLQNYSSVLQSYIELVKDH